MDPFLTGGIIQGIGNIASTALNNRFQRQENRKARAYNLKMWNLENEYNSPQAQMKRFEEAGLNPNLMYGQGSSGNAGSVSAVAPAQLDHYNMPNVTGLINDYLEYQGKKEDVVTKKYIAGMARANFLDKELTNMENWGYLYPNYDQYAGQGKFEWFLPQGDNAGKPLKPRLMNQAYKLGDALQRIRESEAGMSSSLKGWNLTAADAWYTRLLAKWLEDTSFDKFRRK